MNDAKYKKLIDLSVKEIFAKMITLEVNEIDHDGSEMFVNVQHLFATIGFAGGWNGSVSLQCSERLARMITSKMLMMSMDDLVLEDLRDAMGEVINMVGGKFKALFAEHFNDGIEAFKMSVPTVTTGKNYVVFNRSSDSVFEVVMSSAGERFAIKLALRQTSA